MWASDGAGTGLDADLLDGQHGAYYRAWANLTGVPSDLADGDDDTLGDLSSCSNGQIAEWNGSAWVCAADDIDDTVIWDEISGIVGTGSAQVAAGDHTHDARYYTESELQTSGSASVHWGNLTNVPAGLADGDDDTLGDLSSCSNGQIAEWNGSAWVCAADDDTIYSAGTGLDLSGAQFSVASTYRLPQSCANGQIAEWNGSVWVCAADDNSTNFWSLTGNAGTIPGTHFLGTSDNQALQLHVNGARALRLEPNTTSPNVIGGYSGNSVAPGVLGATIGGGGLNLLPNHVAATAHYAAIGGGEGNTISGFGATIGGGGDNDATGVNTTVGGGYINTANGDWSTVGGGESNLVTATHGTIAGGRNITVTGDYAAVGGGYDNVASGDGAFVGGGGTSAG